MNKSDLISAMADKAGITKAQAGEALDGVAKSKRKISHSFSLFPCKS
jgi:nucleoid DNA-binding protein